MEFKTLEKTRIEAVHEAFVDAFSDYQVKMDLPLEKFQKMMKRRGFSPALSMGAFEEDKLVGFVLNGCRDYQGRKTVYDMGTGVVKEYRRQGITSRILEELTVLLKENGVEQYLLEVLQENTSAYELYLKQGFRVTRGFHCYRIRKGNPDQPSPYTIVSEKPSVGASFSDFWDFVPSWQNGVDSVKAAEDTFTCLVVKEADVVVGYGLIDQKTGDIPQLAVKKTHRRRGIGRQLLSALLEETAAPQGVFLNIEDTMETMISFVLHEGGEYTVSQYEMIKDLS